MSKKREIVPGGDPAVVELEESDLDIGVEELDADVGELADGLGEDLTSDPPDVGEEEYLDRDSSSSDSTEDDENDDSRARESKEEVNDSSPATTPVTESEPEGTKPEEPKPKKPRFEHVCESVEDCVEILKGLDEDVKEERALKTAMQKKWQAVKRFLSSKKGSEETQAGLDVAKLRKIIKELENELDAS